MFCLEDEELLMDLFNTPEEGRKTLKIQKSKKLSKKSSSPAKKTNSSKKKKNKIQEGLDLVFEGFKHKLSAAQKMEIIGFASKFFG